MVDERKGRSSVGDEVREGIRAGIGILSALKDAVEETVQDMLDRGELSPERAREAVRTTMDRAQATFDEARTRLDFVPRREFEALQAEVAQLRRRVDELGGGAAGGGASNPGQTGPSGAAGDIPVTES